MTPEEIQENAQKMVDIYNQKKDLQSEYSQIRELLKNEIDTNGVECNGGKVVLVQGGYGPCWR